MTTQAWQAIRSTNAGILVESARFPKTFQNDGNVSPKVSLTWDAALWNTVTGLTKLSASQFEFGQLGVYLLLGKIEVFSPSSAKLQVKISAEVNTVPLPQASYTGLTVATDFNSSVHVALFVIDTPNSVIETFGERAGQAGEVQMISGEFNVLRLSNFDPT